MAYSNKYSTDSFSSMTDEELMAVSDDDMEDHDPAVCKALMEERMSRDLPPRTALSYTE